MLFGGNGKGERVCMEAVWRLWERRDIVNGNLFSLIRTILRTLIRLKCGKAVVSCPLHLDELCQVWGKVSSPDCGLLADFKQECAFQIWVLARQGESNKIHN